MMPLPSFPWQGSGSGALSGSARYPCTLRSGALTYWGLGFRVEGLGGLVGSKGDVCLYLCVYIEREICMHVYIYVYV